MRHSRPLTHLPQHLPGSLGGSRRGHGRCRCAGLPRTACGTWRRRTPAPPASGRTPPGSAHELELVRPVPAGPGLRCTALSSVAGHPPAVLLGARHPFATPIARRPPADMVLTHLGQSEPVRCVNTLRARLLSWAMLGSNQRPPRCQRGALPLRQSPSRRRRESNPRTGLCRPLPKPLGHSASANVPCWGKHGFGHPKYRAGQGPAGRNPAPPSGRRDSNPRPSPWQGDALPTEPRPHVVHSQPSV